MQVRHTRINPVRVCRITRLAPENSWRQQSNKAYATVLRSLSRLEERGLVQWKFTDRNKRYPVFSDYGHSFWLDPKEFDHISGKVKLIDEMLNQATKENEQKLKEIFSKIADTLVEKIE